MRISRGNGLLIILGVAALFIIIYDMYIMFLWTDLICPMFFITVLATWLIMTALFLRINSKVKSKDTVKRDERAVIGIFLSLIIIGGTLFGAVEYIDNHSYKIEINRHVDNQQERLVLNTAEHLDYGAMLNISRYRCGDVMDPAVGSEPYYIDSIVIDQYQDWVGYRRANNIKGIYHVSYRAGVHVVDKLNVSAQSNYPHQSIGWSTEPKTVDIYTEMRPWTIMAVSNGTDYDVVRRGTRVNLTKDFLGQYLVEMHFESQGYYLRQYVLFGQDMQVPFVYAERNIWFY